MDKQEKKRRLMTLLEQEFGPVAVGARPRPRLVAGASANRPAIVNEPTRRVLRPTEARRVYGYPGEGMKTGSDG